MKIIKLILLFIFITTQAFAQSITINAAGGGGGSNYWNLTNLGISTTYPVGIGSTNPGTALDVQGTVRTTGFQLSTNPSSGYVLTSNGVGVGTWMPSSGGGGGSGTVTSITASLPLTGGTITTSGSIGINTTLPWNGVPAGAVGVSPITFNSSNGNIGITTTGPWNGNAATSTTSSNTLTNANLTGVITSVGNATSTGSQTGTGSVFVMQASPYIQGSVGLGTTTINGTGATINGTITDNLTASQPIINNSSSQLATGTYKGNTTVFQMNNGTLTSGNIVKADANQNIVDGGIAASSISTQTFGTLTNTDWCTTNGTSISCTSAIPVTSLTGDNFFISNSSSTGAVTLTQATHTQNTVMGAATSTAAADLAVPSCSGGSNALTWTTNTGFGCNTISGSGTNYWNYTSSGNVGVSTIQAVGIGTTFIGGTGEAELAVMGNVGIGTWTPSGAFEVGRQKFDVFQNGNIGIGTVNTGNIFEINDINNSGTTSNGGNYALAIYGSNNGSTTGGNNANVLMKNQNASGYTETDYTGDQGQMAVGFAGSTATLGTNSGYVTTYAAYPIVIESNYNTLGNKPAITVTTSNPNNVGIGTVSPITQFDINRKFNVTSTGNVGVGTWNPATIFSVGTNSVFNVSSTTGNLGIGTINPQSGFLIQAMASNPSANIDIQAQNLSSTGYGAVSAKNDEGSEAAIVMTGTATSGAIGLPNNTAYFGSIRNSTPVQIGTNDTIAMFIDNNNNVGIGTISPTAALQIGTDTASVANATILCNCSTKGGVSIGKCTGTISGDTCTSCSCIGT